MNVYARTCKDQCNLSDLPRPHPYMQPLMCFSLQKGCFHTLPQLAKVYAQPGLKLHMRTLHTILCRQEKQSCCYLYTDTILISFPLFHLTCTQMHACTPTNTHRDLQCSKTCIGDSESSIKRMSVQLYLGPKTALARNPSGHSLPSKTMQHTSEVQEPKMK